MHFNLWLIIKQEQEKSDNTRKLMSCIKHGTNSHNVDNNTFHWAKSVIGHIMRLPPFSRALCCSRSFLSKPGNLVAFTEGLVDSSKELLIPLSPSLMRHWTPVNAAFHEWASIRDMVITVFPRPIASARICKKVMTLTYYKTTTLQSGKIQKISWVHTPPLAIWSVLGKCIVASPVKEFR